MKILSGTALALIVFSVFLLSSSSAYAATDLKLNPDLNYSSDSNDGPLITGDNMHSGAVRHRKPAYIIFYHRECYNSKRQVRRTVELYDKYMGRVDFIIVDLDSPRSKEQNDLCKEVLQKPRNHIR